MLPALPRTNPSRRRRILVVAVAAALAVLGGGAKLFFSRGAIPAAAWIEFAPPGDRCRVLLPGAPTTERAAGHAAGLGSGRKFSVLREAEDVGFFLCTLETVPEGLSGAFARVYAAERDHMLQKAGGRLTTECELTLDGCPGKEFEAQLVGRQTLLARVYLGRGRLYILVAGGPHVRSDTGDAARFFNSFHIEP